ncbi:MAG: sialidase family protein [Acidobacteriota bacterium]|nr:sialidase family protein [Acidobacteriota bacterium]
MRHQLIGGLSITALFLVALAWFVVEPNRPGKTRQQIRNSGVRSEVVLASPDQPAETAALPARGFTPMVRLGFDVGEGWEPAVAADDFGHVYVLIAQYGGVPGCTDCSDPSHMIVQVSADSGATWDAPRTIIGAGDHQLDGQWDPQIIVDLGDRRTVYASWLQNKKGDIAVARSTDFGATWQVFFADSVESANDKEIITARDGAVYVAYSRLQKFYVSSSQDAGETWTTVAVPQGHAGAKGLPLFGGGTVTTDGTVYFSGESYEKSGSVTGKITLWMIKSTDRGATWETFIIDEAWAAPDCFLDCGWGFLSSQLVMTSDDADNLYLLWDGSDYVGDPGRMYFAASSDGGLTWTPRFDVSTAPADIHHNFPAIAATGNGDVRISWMDARNGGPFAQSAWTVWYRVSKDGGLTWSDEEPLSHPLPGYDYLRPEGFDFPYGDYYELDIDGDGVTHLIFGAGESYSGDGKSFYVRGNL